MKTRIETLNSVYEVDEEGKRVRRVSGEHRDSQFPIGEWREYSLKDEFNSGLYFQWEDGSCTITSPIQYAEEIA